MVRAPCCEKMGLKKGPWTPEEDQILINYIQLYGHGNWRALPKQAGLLRCGKSCRLRWTNYLRPDIKRGNFTREDEDTIIKLHEMLGNRWSAIAARLPGRTDNEIKNVWHTHLKKRLKQNQPTNNMSDVSKLHNIKYNQEPKKEEQEQQSVNSTGSSTAVTSESLVEYRPILLSPQQESSSDISSVDNNTCTSNVKMESSSSDQGCFIEIDENFWEEVLSADNSATESDFSAVGVDPEHQFLSTPTPLAATTIFEPVNFADTSNLFDNMDFWHNLFAKAGDLPELLEI